MEQDAVAMRLKEFLNSKGWTARDFERMTGLGNGTAARISKSTRVTTFNRISNSGVGLNIEWLRTGKGKMIQPNGYEGVANATMLGGVFSAGQRDDDVAMVDFVPISAMASFIESLSGGSAQSLDKHPLIPMGSEKQEIDSLCVFEVEGDSMFPTIPSGSLILAKEIPRKSWHYAEGVVVAVFNEYVVVKRVARNCLLNENYIVLRSDNDGYGEITVALTDLRGLFKAKRIISSEIR